MRAEFAGVLSGVSLVQGGLISANERVGQLIDPSALEVAFRVSTQQYARLLNEDGTYCAPADVSLDAIGGSVTSRPCCRATADRWQMVKQGVYCLRDWIMRLA